MDLNQGTLYIFTDGSCYPNPGPGGWASILIWNGNLKLLYGGSEGETNNTMEFRGILEGLKARTEKVPTIVYSDSQYCINALTVWWKGWQKKGWLTASGDPVKNQEFIREILHLTDDSVTFKWLKGHAGNTFNEAADKLALKGRKSLKKTGVPDSDADLSVVRGLVVPHISAPKPGKLPFADAEDPKAPMVERVEKPSRSVPSLSPSSLRDTLAGFHFMSHETSFLSPEELVTIGYARADEFLRISKEKGEL